MVLRVRGADIKLYLVPSSTISFAYFQEELSGRYKPEIERVGINFVGNTYEILFEGLKNFAGSINLKLNLSGRMESQHPVYYPKLKKFASGYCLSFVLKDGDHQWLAIITDNKEIPESFVYYKDDFGEEDI